MVKTRNEGVCVCHLLRVTSYSAVSGKECTAKQRVRVMEVGGAPMPMTRMTTRSIIERSGHRAFATDGLVIAVCAACE